MAWLVVPTCHWSEAAVGHTAFRSVCACKLQPSREHSGIVDDIEQDAERNSKQSWADLVAKNDCSRYTMRRKLTERGFHTYKSCKTLKCKTVHFERRHSLTRTMHTRLLAGTGKIRLWQRASPLQWDKIVFSDDKIVTFSRSELISQNCRNHTATLFKSGFLSSSPDFNPLDHHTTEESYCQMTIDTSRNTMVEVILSLETQNTFRTCARKP